MSNSWKNILINPEATILDALGVIDNEALQVALVVNSEQKLLGVITDGDIRRGILNNLSLDTPVTEIMNCSPITAEMSSTKEQLTQLMESKSILAIPLIENGKVVGLETLQRLLETTIYQNPVFIMAGGFGTRLRPLTDSCPKPMLKVGDKPILDILITNFIKAGFVNFYISTHYMAEQIRSYFGDGSELGVKIHYIHEEAPLGTGGALGLLPDDLPKGLPLIMVNGDVLTKVDFERLLDFHNEHQADATMCVRKYDYQVPYGVVSGEGNKVTCMVEKPVQHFFVNAGIYVISPCVIDSVPKDYHIDMPTLLDQHMSERENVLMFPVHEYWLDIGRMADFERAQTDILSLGL